MHTLAGRLQRETARRPPQARAEANGAPAWPGLAWPGHALPGPACLACLPGCLPGLAWQGLAACCAKLN